jgi:hypothetical protein
MIFTLDHARAGNQKELRSANLNIADFEGVTHPESAANLDLVLGFQLPTYQITQLPNC